MIFLFLHRSHRFDVPTPGISPRPYFPDNVDELNPLNLRWDAGMACGRLVEKGKTCAVMPAAPEQIPTYIVM